jgi:fusion and transport protein UGO1
MYSPPVNSWSFVPPNASTPAPPPTTYQWSTRPPPNSIFELSPSLSLSEPQGIDVHLLLKTLVASAFLQYTSTALAMPLEVGKLLLQVQWVPRDLSLLEGHTPVEEEVEEDDEVRVPLSAIYAFKSRWPSQLSDSSNDHDGYFIDPTNFGPTKYQKHFFFEDRLFVVLG